MESIGISNIEVFNSKISPDESKFSTIYKEFSKDFGGTLKVSRKEKPIVLWQKNEVTNKVIHNKSRKEITLKSPYQDKRNKSINIKNSMSSTNNIEVIKNIRVKEKNYSMHFKSQLDLKKGGSIIS